MQNIFKQFGAKGINSFNKRFQLTIFRLTLIYVAILAIILFASGSITYSAFSNRLDRHFGNFGIIRTDTPNITITEFRPPSPEEVRAELIESLIRVNVTLLIIAGLLSYGLAWLTLLPIKAAYERQRRFLGDASHELRTPLTILKTDLENEITALKSGDTNKRAESHLEEVERMSKLVNDLLTLSRLDENGDSGKVQAKSLINVSETIKQLGSRLQTLADQHKVKISITAPPADAFITAEEDLLIQTLTNIIKNAVSYNKPEGQVNIIIAPEGRRLKISVEDTGVGMAPDDLSKIYERFYRAEASRSRATGGSGLGLSIARSAVEHMNGSIDIQSEINKGTSVTIILPIK